MAFRLPRRLKLGCKFDGRCWSAIALIGISTAFVSPATAQTSSGGHKSPAVTVDDNVLDRLGPPPTGSQQRNSGAIKPHATAHSRTTGHKTAVVKAPAKTASSPHETIHLIPPKSRLASAAPRWPGKASHPAISHQQVAVSAATKPAVAALAAPVPAPKQLASSDTATQIVAPPQQARSEAPTPAVVPPAEPAVAAKPVVAAPTIAAGAATPAPPPTATPAAPSAATLAAAAPAPSPAAGPPPPVTAAPPVQMAAATTVGSGETAVKFKPGITDLGSGAQPVLDALANRLLANQELRVQLVSHATGTADDAMEARRVSLARAVAIRAYLIDKGVRSLRIDVRALGNRADNSPIADQVDLLVVSQ